MVRRLLLLLVGILTLGGVAYAQGTKISGTVVTQDDGSPVVGASILVVGTKTGTITDVDGNFTLDGAAGKQLRVSYIGMQTQTVKAKNGMTITLVSDSKQLDDVMVVAYGTVKKSAFTGSATEVTADKIETPAASIDKGLAGQVAGLQVISNSGQPGSGTEFRVRGSGSLSASNNPLLVVDGVAISNKEYSEIAYDNDNSTNVLSALNPDDIESITVLKDAAAAALYGSRAANGVIVITTKQGHSGKTKVTVDAKYTSSSMAGKYNMISSDKYYGMLYRSFREQGLSVEDANTSAAGYLTHNPYNTTYAWDDNGPVSGAKRVVNTDWQDEIFHTASTWDLNANVSGGNDRTQYFFSVGYLDQDGVSPKSGYKRYSGNINVTSQATDWLKVGLNAKFSQGNTISAVGGGAGASALMNSVQFPNAVPVYVVDSEGVPVLDENGNKQYNYVNPTSRDFNPLSSPYLDVNRSKETRLIASAFAEIKFLKDFTLRSVISPDFTYSNEHRYWNRYHGNGPSYNARLDKFHTTDYTYTWTNTLNFNHQFGEDHTLNVLAGSEYWRSSYEYLTLAAGDILGEMQEFAAASNVLGYDSYTTRETMISYFGRAEYSYKDLYNLSGSLRTDGSSVFGANNRWGTFWSVGGSWHINNEAFMKDAKWIDNLKLRVSYGTSGNKQGLAAYAAKGLYEVSTDDKYGDNMGVSLIQLANDDLSWESQKMFNVGVDFSFWNSFYGSVDYFYKKSDGLLYDYPISLQSALLNWDGNTVTLNAAETSNSGFEFVLGYHAFKNSPVKWNIELNASFIGDKIKDLYGDNNVRQTSTAKIWIVGKSQYEFYMPTWAGVDPETGNPQWYHVAEDGTRTKTSNYNEATFETQGKSSPTVYGGLHNNVTWRNFSLDAQINYSIGGKIYDGIYADMMNEGNLAGYNLHEDEANAWTTVGQVTDVPKFVANNANSSNGLSTRFLFNATRFKLANVTLSYKLPNNLGALSKVITGGRVYVSGDNLFTLFTDDWKGFDDADIFGVQGYAEYLSVPTPRSFTIGASLTF